MIDTTKFNKTPTGAIPTTPGGIYSPEQPPTGYAGGTGGAPTGAYNPADPYGSFTMGQQGFNAPGMDLWGKAADLYGYAATPQAAPTAWGTAENAYNNMVGTGNPTDVTGWWNAQQPKFQTQMGDISKQMAEQAGLGGMRWSSPLATGIAEQGRRGLENLTADFAGRQITADEAAKQRMMESMSGLTGLGQGQANLGLANTANMFTGAGGLANIGQLQFNAPMQAAQALQNSGNNMWNQQNAMMNQMYNPPWMQGALQASGQSAYGTPQTYQPSFGENMLGVAGQLLPYSFGGVGNWGQGSQGQSLPPGQNMNWLSQYAPGTMTSDTWEG